MANIIDESSQGRKEAQADETKTDKWSWKTWLFYIVCILAIAVATSVASSAEARDWRGGALGTGDAFYNYNSNDFRWVDYHTNRARIREGSAWMLEVRSRDFMPEL